VNESSRLNKNEYDFQVKNIEMKQNNVRSNKVKVITNPTVPDYQDNNIEKEIPPRVHT
jgi:hypothetical protein